jgi:hypothetical protein
VHFRTPFIDAFFISLILKSLTNIQDISKAAGDSTYMKKPKPIGKDDMVESRAFPAAYLFGLYGRSDDSSPTC